MATLSVVQFDTVYAEEGTAGDTLEEVIAVLTAKYNVTATVVNPAGPGGGWPVVEYRGAPEDVDRMIREYWAIDEADYRDIVGAS